MVIAQSEMVSSKVKREAEIDSAVGASTKSPPNTRKRKVPGTNSTAVSVPSQGQPKRRRVKTVSKPKGQSLDHITSDSTLGYQGEELGSNELLKKTETNEDSKNEPQKRRGLSITKEAQQASKESKKGKEGKEVNAMPLAARVAGVSFKIGAHVYVCSGTVSPNTNIDLASVVRL